MDSLITDDETLINIGQLKKLLGGVSDMFIHRRLRDGSGFPAPDAVIANRRYWKLGRVREWRDAQSKGTTHGPVKSEAEAELRPEHVL
jgi:hypothetical protein